MSGDLSIGDNPLPHFLPPPCLHSLPLFTTVMVVTIV